MLRTVGKTGAEENGGLGRPSCRVNEHDHLTQIVEIGFLDLVDRNDEVALTSPDRLVQFVQRTPERNWVVAAS